MSKTGFQPTIPALLKRKRKLEEDQERAENEEEEYDEPACQAVNKRRSVVPIMDVSTEVILLESPETSPASSPVPCSPDANSSLDPLAEITFSRFRELSCKTFPLEAVRPSPLPSLSWAEPEVLWSSLLKQDWVSSSRRGEMMFTRNPQVLPRMRSILLDWLIEVSDVYKLHRETYYLAQDYLDRVLLIQKETPKHELQLLGITCLFLAAKVEEIYPPKVAEFAYVTDGACKDKDILDHEMIVLKALNWELCPLTAAGWLRFYLQLACQISKEVNKSQSDKQKTCDLEMPRFPSAALPLVARLLDLATLDSGSMSFRYSVLAAASLALVYGRELATSASCLSWSELRPCVAWMAPFAVAVSSSNTNQTGSPSVLVGGILDEELMRLRPELRLLTTASVEDGHNLQTHAVSLDMLEMAQALLTQGEAGDDEEEIQEVQTPNTRASSSYRSSLSSTDEQPYSPPQGLLTPPTSIERGMLGGEGSKLSSLRPTELFAGPSHS